MADISKWYIPMLITISILMIDAVIHDAYALTTVRKAISCYFSTSSTSFVLVSCTNGTAPSITFSCGSNCNALATATYTQAISYGGTFYARLNIDGNARVTVFTQCTGVGGTTSELDGRIGNIS